MLLLNHIISSLLKSRYSSNENQYPLLLKRLTSKQQLKVKGPIINVNNRLYRLFNSFNSFSSKFSFRNRLIDIFSSYFSFHLSDRKYAKFKKAHLYKLNKHILHILIDFKTTIIVLDASIKNQVAMFITHIHIYDSSIIKMIHYTINITSTKAKLFMIRYSLNQATY